LQAKTSENGAFGFLSADVDFTWEELQNPGWVLEQILLIQVGWAPDKSRVKITVLWEIRVVKMVLTHPHSQIKVHCSWSIWWAGWGGWGGCWVCDSWSFKVGRNQGVPAQKSYVPVTFFKLQCCQLETCVLSM
jgi:hypothetical protein